MDPVSEKRTFVVMMSTERLTEKLWDSHFSPVFLGGLVRLVSLFGCCLWLVWVFCLCVFFGFGWWAFFAFFFNTIFYFIFLRVPTKVLYPTRTTRFGEDCRSWLNEKQVFVVLTATCDLVLTMNACI